MSHFAKVQRVGIGSTGLGVVKEVIVADQAFVDHLTTNFPEENIFYVQTSYNTLAGEHKLGGTPLRKNYATPTMIYDPVRDAFYDSQPWPSWKFDETSCTWQPPVGIPTTTIQNHEYYDWDELTTSWVLKTRPNSWFKMN